MLTEEYDRLKNMANAEEDSARIFGMGEEVVRESMSSPPTKRESKGLKFNDNISPTNNDLNDNEYSMPSYQ